MFSISSIRALPTTLLTQTLLLLCGYRSFKALERPGDSAAHTKWLTFWFVHTLFAFAKSVCDYVLVIIPFYSEISVGLLI